MQPLTGKIAVVAGATRGAGRGIAIQLGEAGATVYCTGRSVLNNPSEINRPETIEETAELVTAAGGVGFWRQVDHSQPEQVKALFEQIEQEQSRLDLLVNNISGDHHLTWGMLSGTNRMPFWKYPIEKGLACQVSGIHTHLITSYFAAPLMVKNRSGLIIEVTDGNHLLYNNVGVYYSMSKTGAVMLAYHMSEELREHNVAAVSLTPGWLRGEKMLDNFGVTADNWQDALEDAPDFITSESPAYIGQAVVALATDPKIMERSGHSLSAGYLAQEYGFTDSDGRQPSGYREEAMFKNGYFMLAQ